jgi:hypothetical protein
MSLACLTLSPTGQGPAMMILPLADERRLDWDIVLGIVAAAFIVLVLGLLALNFFLQRRARKARTNLPNESMELDLEATPLPGENPSHQRLCILGNPVAMRLVVVAPTGQDSVVDPSFVTKILEKAHPGLAAQYSHDQPPLKVWPPQLSRHGFPPAFFRNARVSMVEGELSRWVLVAGETVVGKKAYLIGLGMWTDEPCGLGKIVLEGHHWIQYFGLLTAGPQG